MKLPIAYLLNQAACAENIPHAHIEHRPSTDLEKTAISGQAEHGMFARGKGSEVAGKDR